MLKISLAFLSMIRTVANWKLNGSRTFCKQWFKDFTSHFSGDLSSIAVAPPAIYIPLCTELSAHQINICAQNLDSLDGEARTGEISLEMLQDLNCNLSIIGHSERRHLFGETSNMIRDKLLKAAKPDFNAIYCIGENLADYEAKLSFEAITEQLNSELLSLSKNINLFVAYEPIWAIGSGKLPSKNEIELMHLHIKDLLLQHKYINLLGIFYGGSVTEHNCIELSQSDAIDGFLVGGASLSGKSFAKIASSFT